jgi:hypothetical protein
MKKQLLEIFNATLKIFLDQEAENISSGVSERNLCGRLALYLDEQVKKHKITGYFVDAEYNRMQNGRIKAILDDDFREIYICCDFILHSRGLIRSQDNLIAIEMKKSTRPEAEKINDRYRLRALTKDSFDKVWSFDGKTDPEYVCRYILGFYIVLDINGRACKVEQFEKGRNINSRSHDF